MKIVVEKNRRKKWFWKVVSCNGKILAHSEDYSSKTKCFETVHRLGSILVVEEK